MKILTEDSEPQKPAYMAYQPVLRQHDQGEGFDFIGIEQNQEYAEIARKRMGEK